MPSLEWPLFSKAGARIFQSLGANKSTNVTPGLLFRDMQGKRSLPCPLSVKKLKNTKEKKHHRKNKEIKISLHLKNISANIVPRFSKKSRASNRQWSKRTQNWPKMFAKCFSTTNSQRVMNFSHVAVWRTLSSSMTNWSRMFRPRFYVPYKNVPPINRLKA